MISPLLAKICKLETHKYDHFEAPCNVCKTNNSDHLKLPHLGTEVSVCRSCRTLKYQVFCIGSEWIDELNGVVYKYNPTTGTHEKVSP